MEIEGLVVQDKFMPAISKIKKVLNI